MKMIFNLLCALLLAGNIFAMNSSKALEGYPSGYFPECPGSEKEAIIVKSSLKYLSIFVQGINLLDRRRYNYFQTSRLAKDPELDFKKMTLLYVGGYMDSPVFPVATFMAQSYKQIGYNVLLLDTNAFTTMPYPRAVRFMRPVGLHTAKMLADLTKAGLDPKKLELMGLSLGGQTSSFIAKSYRDLTGMNISRITALDPAGPCFRNRGPDGRIDKTDADFVEILHTNIDMYGMAAPVGHIDYYINGGENQVGEFLWIYCMTFCSHIRAHKLWQTALFFRDSFIAIKCDSVQQARDKKCYDRRPVETNLFGLNVNKSIQGIFYLATSNIYPFYLGKNGLRKEYDFYSINMKSLNKDKVLKMR